MCVLVVDCDDQLHWGGTNAMEKYYNRMKKDFTIPAKKKRFSPWKSVYNFMKMTSWNTFHLNKLLHCLTPALENFGTHTEV